MADLLISLADIFSARLFWAATLSCQSWVNELNQIWRIYRAITCAVNAHFSFQKCCPFSE